MKRKFALLCALAAAVASLAGCAGTGNNAGTSGTTTTTTRSVVTSEATTTTEIVTTTVMPDFDKDGERDGEYEAGSDGIVSDDGTDELPPETDSNGILPDRIDKETDEAAFASSYIAHTALGNTKIGWGLGKERDEKNRPIDAVKAEEKYAALGGKFIAPEGTICLTFDEGYENGYTAAILDTLAEKNVKAVFFVTYDYCKSAPELVRRMIDEGHTVGNHTWSHPSLPDCTQKEVWAEVTKLHDYVRDEFGYEMTLFRFPKGEFSESTLEDVHNLGYTSLFWSFAYEDWDVNKHTDPAEALAKIEDSTHSGIYLLHAVSQTNAEIPGTLLDYWKEQGYSVTSEV